LTLSLAVTGGTVVLPGGAVPADVGVDGERIAVIAARGTISQADRVIDASGRYVLPGLVDPHTHPGNFRPLGPDIASETRSAAVGGVTSMLGTVKVTRMADDSPEFTTEADAVSYLDRFGYARRSVEKDAHVDVGFSFIVMTRQHAREVPDYVRECGVTSFKFFATNPPSTRWGARVGMPVFPDDGTIFAGFRACGAVGAMAMVHAENGQVIDAIGPDLAAGRTGLAGWEARFPGSLEASEIRKAAGFARETGARYYAVHVTSKEGMAAVEAARREGTDLVAETCPQYLTLDVETHASRGPLAKFNPPVRRADDVAALWSAITSGAIQAVGSDHVPNLRATKIQDGSVENAIAGSAGVATLLPLLWTHGVGTGRIAPERLVEIASTNPARYFGLYPQKGVIRPGSDADLVVVDASAVRAVEPAALSSWADCSAYEGMALTGWPVVTVLRGTVVAEGGSPVGAPSGRYLARSPWA
jgi:dihydropyrimidinase